MQQEKNIIIDDEENEEFEGELPYCFYPSVTRTISVNGKPYTVKSYFTGGKDFHAAVKRLAVKQAYKQAR